MGRRGDCGADFGRGRSCSTRGLVDPDKIHRSAGRVGKGFLVASYELIVFAGERHSLNTSFCGGSSDVVFVPMVKYEFDDS